MPTNGNQTEITGPSHGYGHDESAASVRKRLAETLLEYAEHAQRQRRWEAAAAFQTAADLVRFTGYSWTADSFSDKK